MIKVGKDEVELLSHKGYLEKQSALFSGWLQNRPQDCPNFAIQLPDEIPDTVGFFLDWLYRSDLPLSKDDKSFTADNLDNLASMYLFALRYEVTTLKRDIQCRLEADCSKWSQECEGEFPDRALTRLWNMTDGQDPMREVMINGLVKYVDNSYYVHARKIGSVKHTHGNLAALPADLLAHVAIKLCGSRRW